VLENVFGTFYKNNYLL